MDRFLKTAAQPLSPTQIAALQERLEALDRERAQLIQSLNGAFPQQIDRSGFDLLSEIVFTASADGGIDYANRFALDLVGMTAETASGDGWLQAIHPEDHDRASGRWLEAIHSREKFECSYRVRLADGSYRWYLARAVLVQELSHGTPFWVGTATDIHEQKLLEDELRANEGRLRLITAATRIGLWTFDYSNGSRHWWSPEAYAIAGIPTTWLPNYPEWLARVHPDDRLQVDEQIQEAVRGPRDEFIVGYRIFGDDGLERWHESRGRVERDATGMPRQVYGITIDSTEHRRADEALKASEERYRRIIETAAEGIWILNDQAITTFANRRMGSILGYTVEEMMGKSCFEFVLEEDRERAVRGFSTRKTGIEESREYRYRHRDGHTVWCSISASVLRDAAGQLVGVLGLFTDITARKRAEAALSLQAEELARSNAELERFAYAASHDLQEPLRTISSYTQLLQRRYGAQLAPEAADLMQYIVSGAARMSSLIEDLLSYSRVLHSPSTPEDALQPVSLDQLLGDVKRTLAAQLQESGTVIESDPLPVVLGNPLQLTLVLQNLISNAIKYRRIEQTPLLRITARLESKQWRITVADNGMGFAPEYADRIFGLFKRLHGREIPGTGIGLAIVKRVVERHGGRIWAESEGQGHGARFVFTLPMAEVTVRSSKTSAGVE